MDTETVARREATKPTSTAQAVANDAFVDRNDVQYKAYEIKSIIELVAEHLHEKDPCNNSDLSHTITRSHFALFAAAGMLDQLALDIGAIGTEGEA